MLWVKGLKVKSAYTELWIADCFIQELKPVASLITFQHIDSNSSICLSRELDCTSRYVSNLTLLYTTRISENIYLEQLVPKYKYDPFCSQRNFGYQGWNSKNAYFFCGSFMFLFCLVFAMSLCASVYMCFVVTCWERADLLALVCGVYCEFVTFPLVSWVRCGT